MAQKGFSPSLSFLNYFLKLLLIAFFVIAFVFDLPQLAGKGMEYRAPFYISALLIIPLIAKAKKYHKYPHLADIFVSIPLLLDTGGNLLGLFEKIILYDDILHMLNWTFFILVFHLLRPGKMSSKEDTILLGTGLGALMIVIWEILEWLLSVDGLGVVTGLRLTYNDTVGDLFTSTLGGFVGSVLWVWYKRRHIKA